MLVENKTKQTQPKRNVKCDMHINHLEESLWRK